MLAVTWRVRAHDPWEPLHRLRGHATACGLRVPHPASLYGYAGGNASVDVVRRAAGARYCPGCWRPSTGPPRTVADA